MGNNLNKHLNASLTVGQALEGRVQSFLATGRQRWGGLDREGAENVAENPGWECGWLSIYPQTLMLLS